MELMDQTRTQTPMPKWPKWVCHKEVWALKFIRVRENPDGSYFLDPEDPAYGPILVSAAYVAKHQPQIGGYYVVYKDGYQSYSPAQAFEEGYTRL